MKLSIRNLGLLSVVLSMSMPAWIVSAGQVSAGQVGTVVTDQQPAAPANGYPVTGRVLCGDTQRPARYAQITLISATQDEGGDFGGRGQRISARTDLDGNFSANGVPAGDYYVTGSLTGYVNGATEVQAALRLQQSGSPQGGGQGAAQSSGTATDPNAAPAGVPLVHVSAGGASASLTLQRGGVIAGTVQWDDGSPAGGVPVSAEPAPAANATGSSAARASRGGFGGFSDSFGSAFSGATTDDRGRFRLAGIAPGAYLVRANVQAPMPAAGESHGYTRTLNLAVYAPGVARRSEATAITVAGAEEHDDVAITMGLAGMHTVSGGVGSPGAAVRSGFVSLSDQTDSSLTRTGIIGADGSFLIQYVPPGNYTLNVTASSQPQSGSSWSGHGGPPPSGGTRFQPLQESVTVTDGDLTGLALNVTPATPAQ